MVALAGAAVIVAFFAWANRQTAKAHARFTPKDVETALNELLDPRAPVPRIDSRGVLESAGNVRQLLAETLTRKVRNALPCSSPSSGHDRVLDRRRRVKRVKEAGIWLCEACLDRYLSRGDFSFLVRSVSDP